MQLQTLKLILAGPLDKNNPTAFTEEEFRNILRNKDIQYCGNVKDIRQVLKKTNISVLLSKREGLPLGLMEAAAVGRSIIATDVTGCREVAINDYNAIGRVDIEFLNDDEIIISYMEYDDNGTYLKIKKVSDNGNISEPITISKIDGGRSTGVPQLEIINTEIFLVWTVFENGLNQLKSVKLNSISI